MTPEEGEYILKWYTKANSDLLVAKMAIEMNPLILDAACFHC